MHDLSHVRGLNVRQMLDLLAVVDNGGVTAAATALNISQPALTRSIRQLEESLGVPLLERVGRGVAPTRFGVSLARHARTVEAELRHAARDLADLDRLGADHFIVGTSPIASAMLLGPALTRLRAARPDATVAVVSSDYGELLSDLLRGEVDIVVGALSDQTMGGRLVEEMLFQNQLAVLARDNHPLCRLSGVGFRDLADADWVMARRSTLIRRLVANEFRFEGVEPPAFAVETDDVNLVRQLLRSSDFISANPPELFSADIESGALRVLPIRWHGGARPVGFILREHGSISPVLATFIDALRAVGRAQLRASSVPMD